MNANSFTETELGDGHLNTSKISMINDDYDKKERSKSKRGLISPERLNLNLNKVHAQLEEKNPILKKIDIKEDKGLKSPLKVNDNINNSPDKLIINNNIVKNCGKD